MYFNDACCTNIGPGLSKGFEAAQSGDFETALKEWKPLAEGGESVAQHNLGLMYDNGWGSSGLIKRP